jgi:signal transduction histidine kinase/ligand-binding sensor domain-containing protein
MSKICRAFLIAWLLLCVVCFDVAHASKTVVPSGSPYVVDVWGIEDKLPGSSVIAVTQTRDGYLWLGTLYGLVRFDGVRFTVFNEAGLNSSRIVHLFEDSRTNLWVGTESAGIVLIRKSGDIRRFEIGRGDRNARLVSASEDDNGIIWLLTGNGQLCRYQNEKLEVVPAGCKAIVAEKGGPLWLGTDSGLYSVGKIPASSNSFIIQQFIPLTNRLDFLLTSRTGGYWRLADGRIQKWKNNQLERDLGAYPWDGAIVTSACEDHSGNLIVGTYGSGVYWFDANGKAAHLSSELSHSYIHSLVIDSEGSLWVGTDGGGLNRVKRKAFGVLPESEGRTVQSVSQDGQGGLWIGYNGNRIDWWKNGAVNSLSVLPDFSDVYVKAVFADKNQRVWAGISFGGNRLSAPVRLFQFEDGKFQPAAFGPLHQDVSVIHQDRSGKIWIGTQNGLALLGEPTRRVFSTEDGLPANDIRAIADDAEGNLWVGTGGGLARLRDGKFTAFHKKDGMPSEDISCLHVDAEGVLWIGTRGDGLMRYFKNKWTHYTVADGLSSGSIGYLLEDGQGNLWLGSLGLIRVSKKSLTDFANGASKYLECRTYTEADGLSTRECTQGSQPAACRAADGTLWFPTTRGLVSLNPTALHPNSFQPPVIIESVLLDGIEQNTNQLRGGSLKSLTIAPGQQRLEIHYTSLNLGAADQSRFQYLLAGHETEWNNAGENRFAIYTKLPPGDYTFQVKACNEDGVWNTTPTTLAVIVQPPFWRETWFLVVASISLLIFIVAAVYFLSTQRLQRELAILKQKEALEHERSRIARDLHDQLGANLTQVALLGELAETDKDLPNEVEEHAQQISQTARETTKALDEIVWAVNPSNDTLEGLINYACKYAQEYFELAGLRYRLNVPTELPNTPIPPEVRHNVFLAFKEAVNNVVKHAQATEVCVRLRLETDLFILEVDDNGRGPAGADEKTGRNGLRNMRKRMEDVGGSFTMKAAAEQGTLIRLVAPLKTN